MVAVVAVGNLTLDDLVRAQDYALAEAARPFLGSFGYLLVSLGALFSISSALNATLFGGANIAYALAKEGELPRLFERKLWFGASEGLYLTAGLALGFSLFFNLNGLASMTSAVFMAIYLFVLVAHYRLAEQCGGNRPFILFSLAVVAAVFVVLVHYQWVTNRAASYATWITFGGAVLVELVHRSATGRALMRREAAQLQGLAGRIAGRHGED
jgi:amino acid transporter